MLILNRTLKEYFKKLNKVSRAFLITSTNSLCYCKRLILYTIPLEASFWILSFGFLIKCKDCDCVYIGQRSRALKTRVKEHAKAIATLDENSLLAKHHMRHNHQIDLTSVEIVDRSSAWRQRLILEAWHSV